MLSRWCGVDIQCSWWRAGTAKYSLAVAVWWYKSLMFFMSSWHCSARLQIFTPIIASLVNAEVFWSSFLLVWNVRKRLPVGSVMAAEWWAEIPKCQVVPHSRRLLQLHQASEEIRGGSRRCELILVLRRRRKSRHALLRRVPWLRLGLPLWRVVLRGLQGIFQEEHPRYRLKRTPLIRLCGK